MATLEDERTGSQSRPVSVWDRATRVWHWALVTLLAMMWITAERGAMRTHVVAGTVVAGLLLFRLFWGVFGTSTSRFENFVRRPTVVFAYARSLTRPGYVRSAGHNPIGGWSVVAMLLALAVQTGSGLIAVDTDGLNSGPLASLVDYGTGRQAAEVHELAFRALQGLVAIHVLAIAFYAVVKRVDLLTPMISGRRSGGGEAATKPPALTLLIGLMVAGAAIAGLLTR